MIEFRNLTVLLLPMIVSLITACGQEERKPEILFSDPVSILLQPDETTIYLRDYFDESAEVTIARCPDWLDCFIMDKDSILLTASGETEPIGLLSLRVDGYSVDFALKSSEKTEADFVLDDPEQEYGSVAVVGDINSWNPADGRMTFENGVWKASLWINPGTYGYQFEVDGERILDPDNPNKLDNNMGGFNSLLEISGPAPEAIPRAVTKIDEHANPYIEIEGPYQSLFALAGSRELELTPKGENKYSFAEPLSGIGLAKGFLLVQPWSKDGAGPELKIPIRGGNWTGNISEEAPDLYQNTIMYFLMVDRFKNGNPDNDRPVDDDRILPIANHFGGDLEGVNQKISDGYFSQLGINSIWLSPIVQNPDGAYGFWDTGGVQSKFSGYHGYWPISFTEIDDRFGTPDDLKTLVELAGNQDKTILLDLVANHVHEEHPFYRENKHRENYFTDLYLPDGTLNTERWDDHRLTTWFDTFMPTMELRNPEVAEVVSDSAVYWLREYGVLGFRHDATKHIPLSFWRMLTSKIKDLSEETGRNYLQIGETYGSPELIASYIGPGLLDSQFDFNVYDAIINSVIQADVPLDILAERLLQSQKYYGTNHLMGNMSGNQDKPRIMSLATGEVAFDEDSKLAGWTRDIDKTSPEGFDRVAMIHAINFFIPGIPVIYYGDEIGVPGGNDPDNRRMMEFSNLSDEQLDLRSKVSQLAELRSDRNELVFGDFEIVEVGSDYLVASRNYFSEKSWLLLNTSDSAKTLKFTAEDKEGSYRFFNRLNHKILEGEIEVDLPPRSFEIISYNP